MYHLCKKSFGITIWLLLYTFGCSSLPDGDLCRWMNGRKYYIDIGESGTITLWNVTSQAGGTSNSHPRIPQRCSVELITCPSCHVVVSILYLNIPTCSSDDSCRCDYIWIREPAYTKSGQEFCGFKANDSTLYYESKTKLVSVDFLYSYSYSDAFALHFTAKKNVYHLTGGHDYYQSNNSGYFESPYFPMVYPADYTAEYVLRNLESNGYVQLIFTDFQLSPWSYVELFDSNGTRIDVYNGNVFRPPAISSSGSSLTLKFRANDEHSTSGFRAKYIFVNYPEKYWFNKPSTDCGGYVDDFGGAITMMNMASGRVMPIFDCIWLIHPRSTSNYETHVAIRVAQFEEMGSKSSLEIRQGMTSESYLLESVTGYQHHKVPRGQEYVVPATSGFYVRLRGFFGNKSHLAITYATFRYDDCYTTGDFECGNGRCLKHALRCDGFNHCGDGTDEATCFGSIKGNLSPEDAGWWRTMTPNYYFPKQSSSGGTGTNTLILITSLAGLGMFVLTTVMILVKLHRQRQDDSSSREVLHTISGDIDSENNSGNRHCLTSDPPTYDPPPSYEDVVKYYLPPPPTYNSVMQSGDPAQHSSNVNCTEGFSNSGFVPDSISAWNEDHSNSLNMQPQLSVQNEPQQQTVLRVTLPPSPERQVSISNANTHSTTDDRTHNSVQQISSVLSNTDLVSRISLSDHSSQIDGNMQVASEILNDKHSSDGNRERIHPPRIKLRKSESICDCHGACSCSDSSEVKLHRLKLQVRRAILDRQNSSKTIKENNAKVDRMHCQRHASMPLSLNKSNNKEANVRHNKIESGKKHGMNSECRMSSPSRKPSNALFPFFHSKNGNTQNSMFSSLNSLAQALRDPKTVNATSGSCANGTSSKYVTDNNLTQNVDSIAKLQVVPGDGNIFKIPTVSLKFCGLNKGGRTNTNSLECISSIYKPENCLSIYHQTTSANLPSNSTSKYSGRKEYITTGNSTLRKVSSQPNLNLPLSPKVARQKDAVHHKHSKSDVGENLPLHLTLLQTIRNNSTNEK